MLLAHGRVKGAEIPTRMVSAAWALLVALCPALGQRLAWGVAVEVGFVAAGDLVRGANRTVDRVGATGFEQRGWKLELVEAADVVVLGWGTRQESTAHPVPLGGLVDGKQLCLVCRVKVIAEEGGFPGGDERGEEPGLLAHLPSFAGGEALHLKADAEGVVEAVGTETSPTAGEICGEITQARRVLRDHHQVAAIEWLAGECDVRKGAHRPDPPEQPVTGMAVEQDQIGNRHGLRAGVESSLGGAGVDHLEAR
ncbi:hypothetical protein SAMN02745225_02279 [Ferrithrix thermotolerans DSM 19514]|uniref:Uncharacterized protein n=1 Tax=Ferrithrix thermotolerans DSM 19514 TaxID=1121881 RepID=A0A1M4Y9N7_9ACTN|nr:hypothetical protein SAMN02745225_02279 [Ferrithrix thermotolerans DSM 19514]